MWNSFDVKTVNDCITVQDIQKLACFLLMFTFLLWKKIFLLIYKEQEASYDNWSLMKKIGLFSLINSWFSLINSCISTSVPPFFSYASGSFGWRSGGLDWLWQGSTHVWSPRPIREVSPDLAQQDRTISPYVDKNNPTKFGMDGSS